MASKKDQKTKPVRSNDYTPKAGPKSPKNSTRGASRTVSGRTTGTVLPAERSSGFYAGYHADRKAAERQAFIAELDNTVKQARLLTEELVKGEQATYIVEYMIAKYYVTSIESGHNFAASFIDVRNETIIELDDYNVTHGFLRYATNQAFNALKGGYSMAKYGEDFDSALAIIKQRNEQFQQKRMSQLVNA